MHKRQVGNVDNPWRKDHRLVVSGPPIGWPTLYLDCAIGGGGLRERTTKRVQDLDNLLSRQDRNRGCAKDYPARISSLGLHAQPNRRFVGLLMSLKRLLMSRGPTNQKDEEPFSDGIEGARMPDPPCGEFVSDDLHNVVRGHTGRFVDEQ